MTRPLRSNFEPGSVREATRRGQQNALGLTSMSAGGVLIRSG